MKKVPHPSHCSIPRLRADDAMPTRRFPPASIMTCVAREPSPPPKACRQSEVPARCNQSAWRRPHHAQKYRVMGEINVTERRDRTPLPAAVDCRGTGPRCEALLHTLSSDTVIKEQFIGNVVLRPCWKNTAHENRHRISGNGRRMLQMGARSAIERSTRILEAASPGLA